MTGALHNNNAFGQLWFRAESKRTPSKSCTFKIVTTNWRIPWHDCFPCTIYSEHKHSEVEVRGVIKTDTLLPILKDKDPLTIFYQREGWAISSPFSLLPHYAYQTVRSNSAATISQIRSQSWYFFIDQHADTRSTNPYTDVSTFLLFQLWDSQFRNISIHMPNNRQRHS